MAYRIDSVEGRKKLKPRSSAYWHKLSTGCHLGFRKLSSTSEGTWLVRTYDHASQKQASHSLGSFDLLSGHLRFDAAKKEAEAWFEHLGRGGSNKVVTVKSACENYVQHLRDAGKNKNADDTEARFRRWVYEDTISRHPLDKLTRKQVEDWRHRLAKTPVLTNPHSDKSKTKARSDSTLNRDMAALRAALNSAYDHNDVTNDSAWRVALRAIENAGRQRSDYLDKTQRAQLIATIKDECAANFARCLSLLPLRPGALASLIVENFNARLGVLTVGKDKNGADRKIQLPPTTASVFISLSKNKLPAAYLLNRSDGKPWDKEIWNKDIKLAAQEIGLPLTITAYTLRHSVITDLVTGGLDMLTVSLLSGTSVSMIEKHYGHLRSEHAANALAGLAL